MSRRNVATLSEQRELEKLLRQMFKRNEDTEYGFSMIMQTIIDGDENFHDISPEVNDKTIQLVLQQLVGNKAITQTRKNNHGDCGYQWNTSRSNPYR